MPRLCSSRSTFFFILLALIAGPGLGAGCDGGVSELAQEEAVADDAARPDDAEDAARPGDGAEGDPDADASDAGSLALGDALLPGHWVGQEMSGDCIEQASWLSFGADGAFTWGVLESNHCFPPEQRGVVVCEGRATRLSGHRLQASCEATQGLAFQQTPTTLSLDSPALVVERDGERTLSMHVHVAEGAQVWVWHQVTELSHDVLHLGEAQRQRQRTDVTVTLRLDAPLVMLAPDMAPRDVTMTLQLEGVIEREGAQTSVDTASGEVVVDAVVEAEAGGYRLRVDLTGPQPQANPWWTVLRERFEDDVAFSLAYSVLAHTYEVVEGGALLVGVGGSSDMERWRAAAPPCEQYAHATTSNEGFAAWCGR